MNQQQCRYVEGGGQEGWKGSRRVGREARGLEGELEGWKGSEESDLDEFPATFGPSSGLRVVLS